jgi:ParB/RepB/Spo0J family partition protein
MLQKIEKELRVVKMDDLKHYDDNPRHNNESAKMVAESIKEYGYLNPILVTEDLLILAGHTRWKAMKLLGETEVEVLVVKGLSEDQIHGFVIADNRVGEFSVWNQSAIDRLLESPKMKKEMLEKLGIISAWDKKKELEKLIGY